MKLRIKKDAGNIYFKNHRLNHLYGGGISPQAREFGDMITAIQGMAIDVETKYLWNDQFNTAPIEGVSENGLRILDFKGEESIIEEIIDDVRPSSPKCGSCGNYLREDDLIGDPCWWCGK